jgi:hypothetical protein
VDTNWYPDTGGTPQIIGKNLTACDADMGSILQMGEV